MACGGRNDPPLRRVTLAVLQGEVAQSSPSDSSSRGGEGGGAGYVAPALYSKVDGDDGSSPDVGTDADASVDLEAAESESPLTNEHEDPATRP